MRQILLIPHQESALTRREEWMGGRLGGGGKNYDWNVKMKFKNLILLNSLDNALKKIRI